MKKSLTLIVAVYNAVKYLEFIFCALERQSFTDFEVIVADDGSGAEIRSLVEATAARVPFPLRHIWQPDDGFRKNMILNRAVEASSTDYLVFIDGDCLPHRKFLEDHWRSRKTDSVLCGRRVNLSERITAKLSLQSIASGTYEGLSFGLLWDGLLAGSSNLEDALRFESETFRRMIPRNRARILGCNFSLDKMVLESINGFDEDYRSPGIGEDTDVAFRLELVHAQFISLRYLATLYHLYHRPTAVGQENQRRFAGVVARRDPVCKHGLRNLEHVTSSSM